MYVVSFYWSQSRLCVLCVCECVCVCVCVCVGVLEVKEWQHVLRLIIHCVAAATLFILWSVSVLSIRLNTHRYCTLESY